MGLEEMMEMFAATFEGMAFGDGLDAEFSALFGMGGQRRRRRGKIPARLRTATAPGMKAPKARGSRGFDAQEALLQEMLFGDRGGLFVPPSGGAAPHDEASSEDEDAQAEAGDGKKPPRKHNQ